MRDLRVVGLLFSHLGLLTAPAPSPPFSPGPRPPRGSVSVLQCLAPRGWGAQDCVGPLVSAGWLSKFLNVSVAVMLKKTGGFTNQYSHAGWDGWVNRSEARGRLGGRCPDSWPGHAPCLLHPPFQKSLVRRPKKRVNGAFGCMSFLLAICRGYP